MNNIPFLISGVFQTSAAVKIILDQHIQMGLLLDPDEFLANKDLHKVRLSEIERLVIPQPIPDLRLYTMSPQQFDTLIDQIIAANPTEQQIDDHLAQAFARADESNRIIIAAMQNASRKQQALDDFLAYEPVHRRLQRYSLMNLHRLKAKLIDFHTKGILPKGFSHKTPDTKLFLVHQYRHQSQCHPIGLEKLQNIFLKHHGIDIDDYVRPEHITAQSHQPLPSDSLPFTDPLAEVLTAA